MIADEFKELCLNLQLDDKIDRWEFYPRLETFWLPSDAKIKSDLWGSWAKGTSF